MDKQISKSGRWTRRALIGSGMAIAGAGIVTTGILAAREGGGLVTGRGRARRVASDEAMPRNVDVVVVGGGNIGCLTALTLAERGVRVALCEKGVVAGEASGRSMGYIDSQFVDPAKMEMVARSKQLWSDMNARVGGETGYRAIGSVMLWSDQDGLDASAAWLDSAKGGPGIDGSILNAKQAADVAIGAADRYLGALRMNNDATAEPQLAAPAIADAFRKLGGVILQDCAVRGVETEAGRICGVVTEKGAIRCSSVVLAGGAWSPVFARSIGLDLPQFMAFASAVRFGRADGPDTCFISDKHKLVARRTMDGRYDFCTPIAAAPVTPAILAHLARLRPAMVNMWDQLSPVINLETFLSQWRIPDHWALDQRSPFEDNRILQPETPTRFLSGVIERTGLGFPLIGHRAVEEKWAGALTSTLDNMPVISAISRLPGLFVGSGFYYGLTMAPAAGEALADLVMGRKPKVDLNLYRFSRFSDGSKIVFRG